MFVQALNFKSVSVVRGSPVCLLEPLSDARLRAKKGCFNMQRFTLFWLFCHSRLSPPAPPYIVESPQVLLSFSCLAAPSSSPPLHMFKPSQLCLQKAKPELSL